MSFFIRSRLSEELYSDRTFTHMSEATTFYKSLPEVTQRIFKIDYSGPERFKRMIFEGFSKNDLEGLLRPLLSLDEYVSKNEQNMVVAFFVENEPLAVEPLKIFCDQAPGVVETDMSDSDQYENTSIVYVEFTRDLKNRDHILALVKDVAKVANIEVTDFMVSLPNIDKEYEFSERLLDVFLNKAMVIEPKLDQEPELIPQVAG